MRQPGNEFKIDPFKAIGTEAIPAPQINGTAFQKDHEKWATNTAIARQHGFCGNLCVNFKGLGGLQKDEEACINSCFKKYSSAFHTFQEEKQHFLGSLSELALRGEDKYVAREI